MAEVLTASCPTGYVYMTTEDGAVYAMRRDNTGMEMIIQIKR